MENLEKNPQKCRRFATLRAFMNDTAIVYNKNILYTIFQTYFYILTHTVLIIRIELQFETQFAIYQGR